jgi:peptidoglycan/xylan/chitin deacetylase (PgdA/CDA1 family)
MPRISSPFIRIRHHNRAARAGVFAAGVAVGYLGPGLAALVPRLRPLLGVRDAIEDAGAAALTFDDGPHPQGTPAVLEILREAGARATFFLAGEQVEARPALAAEIVAAGHDVAVHCRRHRNLLRLAPWQVTEDLRRAEAAIADATGRELRLYRPPYGVFNAAALRYAHAHRWTPLLWTRWGRDWERRATPASIAAKLTYGLRGGDVLLLHDADHYSALGSWQKTAAALPRVLERCGEAGLRVVAA